MSVAIRNRGLLVDGNVFLLGGGFEEDWWFAVGVGKIGR